LSLREIWRNYLHRIDMRNKALLESLEDFWANKRR